ncbi:MAG TPA: TRAM domain-containing protein, partial [Crenalkalicoccus sp.]|nr:TRAM domain-containing protein [Crenalkalicoccus sp.]
MTEAAELTVAAVGAAGDGIARLPGGGTAFIPGGLPGDVLRCRLGPRRGEGRLAEPEALLAPGPER